MSGPSQLSLAEAVKVTLDEQSPAELHTFLFPGQVTTGFSQSVTVTVNEQLPMFPTLSVAVQLTTVGPRGKA